MATHALFETASGYAIFEVKLHDAVGSQTKAVQDSISDFSKFTKMVSLISFSPFKSAADALENINDVSEGACCGLIRLDTSFFSFFGAHEGFLRQAYSTTS